MSDQNTSYMQAFQKGWQEGKFIREVVTSFLELAYLVSAIAALIPDVFLHRRFGRRYLSFSRLAVLQVAPIVVGLSEQVMTLVAIHLTVSLVHMFFDRRNKERWHSRCCGIPWLAEPFRALPMHRFKTTPEEAAYWIEPLIPLSIALMLGFTPLGLLLAVGAAGMWLRWIVEAIRTRNRIYDVIDAEIEQERFMEALEGQSARASDGFIIPGAARLSDEQRDRMLGGRHVMPQAVLDLLDKSTGGDPAPAASGDGDLPSLAI